ncbi:SDR family NAD(P)-dependent oxidoreductase [uncultured Limosilactobacillus sp.]|uniref:SDR family NAD(P)-dependent oxidoreductase n=1 Tax=uncultured Limosilactobacillus sp. TaxID=2837629 RepID=UPI0025FD4D7D|nr:SDR family NAD(P)-dependent oxidoreductase [uncultured Limosilactobacillus sp.]
MMAKIFITGSSTGLGALAAKELIAMGNDVYLHARNKQRAQAALRVNPHAKGVAIGDLADLDAVRQIATQVNAWGQFDVVIHNAGVDSNDSKLTARVNVEAPYILTALINRPKRLIYVDSGMHIGAPLDINSLETKLSYSSSKLALMIFTEYIAKKWPDVIVNAVDPGWVPTRMGGPAANDDLHGGYSSQVWLATSNDRLAQTSGNCYYHLKLEDYDKRADQEHLQAQLVAKLSQLTGIAL